MPQTEETLILRIQTGDAELTVAELKQGLRQINDELERVAIGSERYMQLSDTMGQGSAKVSEVEGKVKAMSSENRAAALAELGTAIAGGFQLATGAAALLNINSEKAQQALLKVQAAMAITQGVQNILRLGKAFDTLKAIILANPILAIGAAITAIGAAIIAFTRDTDSAKEKTEAFMLSMKEANDIYDLQERKLRALGMSERELITQRIDRTKKELESLKVILQAQLATSQASARLLLKSRNDLSAGRKVLGYLGSLIFGEGAEEQEARRTLMKETEARIKELEVVILEFGNKVVAIDKKAADEQVKTKKTLTDTIKEADLKAEKEEEARGDDHLARVTKSLTDEAALRLKAKADLEAKSKEGEMKLKEQEATDWLIRRSELESRAADEEAIEKKKEESRKFREELVLSGFQLISDIQESTLNFQLKQAEGNQVKQESLRKTFFKRQQKIQIAQALMATYQAANNMFNATSANVALTSAAPAAPFIAAAVAVAFGLANVAKIASQSYQGGGAAAPPPPPAAGATGLQAPVPATGQRTEVRSDRDGGFSGFGAQSAVRAYIVESDISNAQSLAKSTKDQATYP